MSSTNQRLIEKAKDDYNTDYAPSYRQDIFGEVYRKGPAFRRRMEKPNDQFARIWLNDQRINDGAMDRLTEGEVDKVLATFN
jgi:hypothetical protein